jgi:hypothetical protein
LHVFVNHAEKGGELETSMFASSLGTKKAMAYDNFIVSIDPKKD